MPAQALKQRLDLQVLPDGRHQAVLSITMPDGTVRRFTASADESDFAPEIGGLFSGLGRALKKIGKVAIKIAKVAKKVATSKVFLLAAGALASAIPGAGLALGPALIATASTLGAASKLIHAGLAAKHGDPHTAKLLTTQAHQDALRIHRGDPDAAAALLAAANDKRKRVDGIVGPTPAPEPAPAPTPLLGPAWLS